uniref:Uncharacterized protein n=1 Tax=Arundo donax TaxID=35708 RepID=A0A0A8Z8B5_ARUDO
MYFSVPYYICRRFLYLRNVVM